MGQAKFVNQSVQFGDLRAHLLLVELERGRTIIHLRADDPADARELTHRSRIAVDRHGEPLPHLVTLSGGTGVEMHVTHVYDGVPTDHLVLLNDAGEPAITMSV